MLSPSYIKSRTRGQTERSRGGGSLAHDEPPHQDLSCLQIQLFSSLVLNQLPRSGIYTKRPEIPLDGLVKRD